MYALGGVCYKTSGSKTALRKSNSQVNLKVSPCVAPGLCRGNRHVQPSPPLQGPKQMAWLFLSLLLRICKAGVKSALSFLQHEETQVKKELPGRGSLAVWLVKSPWLSWLCVRPFPTAVPGFPLGPGVPGGCTRAREAATPSLCPEHSSKLSQTRRCAAYLLLLWGSLCLACDLSAVSPEVSNGTCPSHVCARKNPVWILPQSPRCELLPLEILLAGFFHQPHEAWSCSPWKDACLPSASPGFSTPLPWGRRVIQQAIAGGLLCFGTFCGPGDKAVWVNLLLLFVL